MITTEVAPRPLVRVRLDILNAVVEQQAFMAALADAACVGCGCTEDAACVTTEGACAWDVDVSIMAGLPVCTTCSAAVFAT